MSERKRTNSDDAIYEGRIEAVIADYIRACETRSSPDRKAILAGHPELADDLRQFFAQHDRMNQLVEPIREFACDQFQAVGPGQQISYVGNYELLEEIARGGMGVVYKARQSMPRRFVAVKLILKGRLATDEDVKRFKAEAQAAGELQHPNIVAIHEVGEHEGWHYFSMDYVSGRDLSAILREKVLSPKQAVTYVRQMAEAIHYAHQQGTLHRDLKPSNVMIDNDDQVRITDFGLAIHIDDDSELTRTGQILGTPSYMPPEQAQGKRSLIGRGSDVYSMGAVLYECLTGRAPFRADSFAETIQQVIHVEAPSPRLLNPVIPLDLETICLKCLEKEPHRRYGTAQLFADDLQRFLEGHPILARPVGIVEKTCRWCQRNPNAAGLFLATAVAILALVGVRVGQQYNSRLAIVNEELADAKRNLEASNSQLAASNGQLEATNNQLTQTNAELADLSTKLDAAVTQAKSERCSARRYLYASQMTLAERARQEGQIGRVMQLLRSVIPESPDEEDLRGFEWHHLWRQYHGEQTRLRGHTGTVTSVAFSPDDKLLASASADKTVKIWDAVSGKELRSLEGHSARVTSIAFHPDGKRLISGSNDSKVMMWEVSTGQQLSVFEGHQGPVTSVAFSPDGSRFVSGSSDTKVRVWDTNTSRVMLEFMGHGFPISSVAFSPDGERVGSVSRAGRKNSGDGTATVTGGVLIWNPDTSEIVARLVGENQRDISTKGRTCLTFSPDGTSVASCDFIQSGPNNDITTRIQVWEVATGKAIKLFKVDHTGPILQMAYSPDGTQLVSTSADNTVKVHDIESGQEAYSFQEEAACLSSMFSHNGLRIVSGCEDHTSKIWDISCKTDRTLGDDKASVNNVAFSPDGSRVAAASKGTVYIWELRTGLELARWNRPNGFARVAWSPTSEEVAIGDTIWNIASGHKKLLDVKNGQNLAGTAFSPDGTRHALTEGRDVVIRDLSGENGSNVLRSASPPDGCPVSVAFSANGKQIAIGWSLPGSLQVWDVETGELSQNLEGFHGDVVSVTFSRDGKLFAAAGGGATPAEDRFRPGEVRVWDTATWQEVHHLRGHQGCVFGIAFSPDGKRLVSAAGAWPQGPIKPHGEVKIWDLLTGLEVGTLQVVPSQVFGVDFSPCGRFIAASREKDENGAVKLFDGTPVPLDEIGPLKRRFKEDVVMFPPPMHDLPE